MMQPLAMETEKQETAKAKHRLNKVGLNAASIERFLGEAVEVDWHVATLRSVSLGTLGVLHAVSLCIQVIGRAAAWARDVDPKHSVKQIDRLLSNENVSDWAFARAWVRFVVEPRPEAIVALDWTEFDADGHSTIAAYLILVRVAEPRQARQHLFEHVQDRTGRRVAASCGRWYRDALEEGWTPRRCGNHLSQSGRGARRPTSLSPLAGGRLASWLGDGRP